MKRALGIGLLGFGGVNRALAELIQQHQANQSPMDLKIVGVSDIYLGYALDPDGLDLDALVQISCERGALSVLGDPEPNNDAVIRSAGCDIVAEATFSNMEDGEPGISICSAAISQAKHVTTTNKGSVAYGAQVLSTLAKENNVCFEYEGSVMSGTPVLGWARNCFPGVRIEEVEGILNGTTNYILGRMEQGLEFDQALEEAQANGFAEADPTSDIEGYDVRAKVMILAQALFGAQLQKSDITCQGISSVTASQIERASAQKERWKLVARIENSGEKIIAEVAPKRVSEGDPLYGINGTTNALSVKAGPLGSAMVCGPGAGRLETAYALYADILKIAKQIESKR